MKPLTRMGQTVRLGRVKNEGAEMKLGAFWSQMTLEPGDIITSGTPGGVAASRQPDPGPWFLKPGDIVEARIEGLGALRNPIV